MENQIDAMGRGKLISAESLFLLIMQVPYCAQNLYHFGLRFIYRYQSGSQSFLYCNARGYLRGGRIETHTSGVITHLDFQKKIGMVPQWIVQHSNPHLVCFSLLKRRLRRHPLGLNFGEGSGGWRLCHGGPGSCLLVFLSLDRPDVKSISSGIPSWIGEGRWLLYIF